MFKYQAMQIRRQALKWNEEILASRAGIPVNTVKFYEEGKNIGRDYEKKIVEALFAGTKELGQLKHYHFRILELAMKIDVQDDKQALMKELSHLALECNKYQMELMDADGFQREYRAF